MSGNKSALSVVVAGGGTAGHIEPALAVADAVKAAAPDTRITALGTARGLETTLVPARGYTLELIPPVPLPRKPTMDLVKLPTRILASVRKTREVLDSVDADVIVTTTAPPWGGLVPILNGLRTLGVNTPMLNSWAGDGNYWLPANPRVTNYFFVTYASVFGDDPLAIANRWAKATKAGVGSYITGPAALDGVVLAIKRAGSTRGVALAAEMENTDAALVEAYAQLLGIAAQIPVAQQQVADAEARLAQLKRQLQEADIGRVGQARAVLRVGARHADLAKGQHQVVEAALGHALHHRLHHRMVQRLEQLGIDGVGADLVRDAAAARLGIAGGTPPGDVAARLDALGPVDGRSFREWADAVRARTATPAALHRWKRIRAA